VAPTTLLRALKTPARAGLVVTVILSGAIGLDRFLADGVSDDNDGVLGDLERASLDLRFRVRGARPVTGEVVIVALDTRTHVEAPEVLKRRKNLARLLRAVDDAGASVIVLDFFLESEEDPLPQDLLDALRSVVPELPDDGPPDRVRALLERVFDEVRGDELFTAAIAETAPVVLALHLGSLDGRRIDDIDHRKGLFPVVVAGTSMPMRVLHGASSLPRFVDAATALGLVSHYEDPDGRSRNLFAGLTTTNGVAMPLAVAAVMLHQQTPRERVVFSAQKGAIFFDGREIPYDDGRLRLNFRGPPVSVKVVSAVDVLEGRVGRADLEGKIALVGITALHEHDRVTTPYGVGAPGLELHATAIENLIANDFLTRTHPLTDGLVSLVAGLLILSLFARRRRLEAGPLLGAAALILCASAAATFATFALLDVWVAAVGPAITQGGTLVVCLVLSYLDDGLERLQLRRAFSRYLSKELLEELLHSPDKVSLSGDRRVLTVLFSDIRNFTTLAEGIPPDALAHLLTRYFTPMTRAVLAAQGYLDKYIGDAIMAVFGAPVFHADHARDACRAVVGMHSALLELQRELRSEGVTLEIGVGLNTGEMVVGNMGSAERFDYTVLGDAVNLASRIEGLTKEYGVFCLVGSETVKLAGASFRFRPIDLVRVKGKERAVEIFELLGDETYAIHDIQDLALWNTAIALYREGNIERAAAKLMDFQEQHPNDPVVALYLDRVRVAQTNPGQHIDSVTTYTKK
jgi:adenylate cyclase